MVNKKEKEIVLCTPYMPETEEEDTDMIDT
jgi:hypothetical protein